MEAYQNFSIMSEKHAAGTLFILPFLLLLLTREPLWIALPCVSLPKPSFRVAAPCAAAQLLLPFADLQTFSPSLSLAQQRLPALRRSAEGASIQITSSRSVPVKLRIPIAVRSAAAQPGGRIIVVFLYTACGSFQLIEICSRSCARVHRRCAHSISVKNGIKACLFQNFSHDFVFTVK